MDELSTALLNRELPTVQKPQLPVANGWSEQAAEHGRWTPEEASLFMALGEKMGMPTGPRNAVEDGDMSMLHESLMHKVNTPQFPWFSQESPMDPEADPALIKQSGF